MACFGDPRVDLHAGQVAALAGLGALCHLDLDFLCTVQIFFGHTESPGGHLFDGAVFLCVQTRRVLAAFSGIGFAAQPVHGDSQGLMCFLRD